MTKPKARDESTPSTGTSAPHLRPSAPALRSPSDRQSAPALRSRRRSREREQSAVHTSPPPHARTLDVPTPERVLQSALGLARASVLDQHEESIVAAFVETLRELFDERQFAVRLVERGSGSLRLAHASGRLREGARAGVTVSRDAVARHSLDERALLDAGVGVTHEFTPLFDDGAEGFDIPLLDGEELLGSLAVEYPLGVTPPHEDPARVGPIALLLASTLRNGQLFRESHYLRDYLAKLLESANAPIVVMGRDRRITVVNRALCALTGFSRDDLIGKDFTTLLPEETRRAILPVYIDALRGQSSSNVDVSVPMREGGHAHLSVNVASVLGADGEVEAIIAIGRDVTEVHHLESQVIQAEKLATLGQLAAGVVHELNNPLTSISVYAEFLLKKAQKSQSDTGDQEKLARIGEAAARILAFTRDLVAYARPSAEQPRPVPLGEVIDQAVVFCDYVIQERGVKVQRKYGGDLPPVFAVRSQLHQVFINLITNACHAMPQGKGALVLSVAANGDGRVVAQVTDNGGGIARDHLERIFEPFWTTKGEGKGTGLGLSIVRNIVQQHRGEITVDSTPGKGTTFTLVLVGKPDV